MQKSFLDAVHQGKNSGWLYFWVIITIVIYWWFLSSHTVLVSEAILASVFGSNEITYFISSHIPFIFVFAFLALSVKSVHHRKVLTLVNAEASINKKRLLLGFTIWGIQSCLLTLPNLLIHPENYQFAFDPSTWFLLLFFSLFLVPIQTSIEELFYRGYLMQGLSLLTKRPFPLIMLTSIAFAIPHFGNPEMQRGFTWVALNYFMWGVFYAAISLKDEGLELALGAHAANNLFAFLIITTPDAVIYTPALFTYTAPINPAHSFLYSIIDFGLFYAIFFGGIPRNPS